MRNKTWIYLSKVFLASMRQFSFYDYFCVLISYVIHKFIWNDVGIRPVSAVTRFRREREPTIRKANQLEEDWATEYFGRITSEMRTQKWSWKRIIVSRWTGKIHLVSYRSVALFNVRQYEEWKFEVWEMIQYLDLIRTLYVIRIKLFDCSVLKNTVRNKLEHIFQKYFLNWCASFHSTIIFVF